MDNDYYLMIEYYQEEHYNRIDTLLYDKKWINKKGETIPLSIMDNDYLNNTINFLERNGYPQDCIDVLKKELNNRR